MKNLMSTVLILSGVAFFFACQKAHDVPSAQELSGEISTCANQPPKVGDCGTFRTQTQGGWGTNPYGGNPGTYLHANFAGAFPAGLVIGCRSGYTVIYTSAVAVSGFLPAGGTAGVLKASAIDPASYSIKNVLVGQVTALALSVGFDYYDPNFGPAEEKLGNLSIDSGPFTGKSVSEFLAIANDVLGGCNTEYSPSQVNQTASSINQNFVDGNRDRGFLSCPTVRFTDR